MFLDECREAIWEEGCVRTYCREVGKKAGSRREDVGSGNAEEDEADEEAKLLVMML